MCGFAGILTARGLSAADLSGAAERMIAPLVHRGPDDGGTWCDPYAGIALGFRRLAIVDLSPYGHQPMRSPSMRFTVVFNGELYNFRELRKALEPRGYAFRGSSDTEVVLAAFEEWGIERAVQRFIGMFAMAVWDADRRELSLLRDRLGKKPLYVYHEPGLVTFGSELKALVAGPSFDRTIDRGALAAYLRYLYVPGPASIFARVVKLQPAHLLTISDPSASLPQARPYWSLRDAAFDGRSQPACGTEADCIDELDALLSDAVRCRMYSDVPIGALLSGGVDSSLVVAMMQAASAKPVKTFTIGLAEEDFNEAHYAARVAEHVGTEHTGVILTGEDARALIPRLPEIFDEPLADPSQLPTLLVSQLARRQVTVALCGDGGDELFGGYNRYVYGTRMLPQVERIPRLVRRGVAATIGSVPAAAWDRMPVASRFGERMQKIGALMTAGSTGEMYRSLLSSWQQPQDLLGPFPDHADTNTGILTDRVPLDLLDRMMLADQSVYLPDDLLAKMDRASMAVSLEVRAPLLDHRIVEFSWRLPRSMKVHHGIGKRILRELLYRRVPRALVDRPKMGFSIPIDRWLTGPLRAWADGLLAPEAIASSGLDPAPVALAWKDLQEGRRRGGSAIWAVLMFQAWRQRWQA